MRLPAMILLGFVSFVSPGSLRAQDHLDDDKVLAQLSKLEKDSWDAAVKKDGEFFRTYMAPEFKGFFADGTTADRAAFIRNLDNFELTSYKMGKVTLFRINEGAVMILYRLDYAGKHKGKEMKMTNIESSSLYVRRDGKWLEIFYQETATPKP